MIKDFRHKGLKRFFETSNTKGIQADHANKLRLQLSALEAAKGLNDLNAFPQWRLHALQGKEAGQYAIQANGNWRLTFMFEDGDVILLDYQDYH